MDGRIQQAWGKLVKGRGGSWPLFPCGAAGCFSCAIEAAPPAVTWIYSVNHMGNRKRRFGMVLGKSTFPPGEGGTTIFQCGGRACCILWSLFLTCVWGVCNFLNLCIYLVYAVMVALSQRKICRSLPSPSTTCVSGNQTWVTSLGRKCVTS